LFLNGDGGEVRRMMSDGRWLMEDGCGLMADRRRIKGATQKSLIVQKIYSVLMISRNSAIFTKLNCGVLQDFVWVNYLSLVFFLNAEAQSYRD
jgi:hypothetical protein